MQPANKALSHLDPNVARCAKQVYTNLQLVERISLLSKTTTIPSEVDKMSRILSYSGKERLDKITRGFLVWSPPNNGRKKNLADFLLQLDKELETYGKLVTHCQNYDMKRKVIDPTFFFKSRS